MDIQSSTLKTNFIINCGTIELLLIFYYNNNTLSIIFRYSKD